MQSIGIGVGSRKQWLPFSRFRPVRQDGFYILEADVHRRSIASDYNRPCAVRSVPMWHDCTVLLFVCLLSDCKALSYLCVLCSDNPFAKIRLHRPNAWKYLLCISSSTSMFPLLRIEPIRIETVCCLDSVATTDWLCPNQCRKWLSARLLL